jgi:hypothetical protein
VLFPAVLVLVGFVYLIEYGPKGSLWVGVALLLAVRLAVVWFNRKKRRQT